MSAPLITSRWPTWTPSKLPIATLRGRGSASGSDVTLTFTADNSITAGPCRCEAARLVDAPDRHQRGPRSSAEAAPRVHLGAPRRRLDPDPVADQPRRLGVSSTLGEERQQLLDRPELVARVVEPERADRGAAQLRAVGVAERPRPGSARRSPTSTRSRSRARRRRARAARRGWISTSASRALDLLPAARLACRGARRRPARRRSSAGAARSAPVGSSSSLGHAAGLLELAVGIAGARAPAEPRGRDVGLGERRARSAAGASRPRAGRSAGRSRRGRASRRGRRVPRARGGCGRRRRAR